MSAGDLVRALHVHARLRIEEHPLGTTLISSDQHHCPRLHASWQPLERLSHPYHSDPMLCRTVGKTPRVCLGTVGLAKRRRCGRKGPHEWKRWFSWMHENRWTNRQRKVVQAANLGAIAWT